MKVGLSDAVAGQRRGQIDYRLARQNAISAFREGSASRELLCDAQSELTRNAVHCGVAVEERCPVCDEAQLRYVTYVFGPRLPSSGRCVTSLAEMQKFERYKAAYTAYVVEVCISCAWNHLLRSYAV